LSEKSRGQLIFVQNHSATLFITLFNNITVQREKNAYLGKTQKMYRERNRGKKQNTTSLKYNHLGNKQSMTENITAFPQELKTILEDENKHLKKLSISQKEKLT